MDRTNSKIITSSFALFAFIIGLTLSLLIKALSGAFGIIALLADSDVIRHGLPVAVGLALFVYLQFNSKSVAWADEIINEVRKVTWPEQKDTSLMTVVVVIMVLISSAIISSFDFISTLLINTFVR